MSPERNLNKTTVSDSFAPHLIRNSSNLVMYSPLIDCLVSNTVIDQVGVVCTTQANISLKVSISSYPKSEQAHVS